MIFEEPFYVVTVRQHLPAKFAGLLRDAAARVGRLCRPRGYAEAAYEALLMSFSGSAFVV